MDFTIRYDAWLIDSGASSHMTCKRELLLDNKLNEEQPVYLGDGRPVNFFKNTVFVSFGLMVCTALFSGALVNNLVK